MSNRPDEKEVRRISLQSSYRGLTPHEKATALIQEHNASEAVAAKNAGVSTSSAHRAKEAKDGFKAFLRGIKIF